MEGGKKIAIGVVLIVVIVGALAWILKSSGMAGGPKPPEWVMKQPNEKIDTKTFETKTLTLGEWQSRGPNAEGLYKNDKGDYTMTSPMTCASCNAKIPIEAQPKELAEKGPEAQMEWQKKVMCPKCKKPAYPVDGMPPPAAPPAK